MTHSIQGHRLSPQQARLWQLQNECKTSAAGFGKPFPARCTISLEGTLPPARIRGALEDLVNRHEILRTLFRAVPGMKHPLQVVEESLPLDWLERESDTPPNEAELDRLTEDLSWDWEKAPLFRACLFTGPKRQWLVMWLPSLCADRRSLVNLFREWADGLAGVQTDESEEPVQYLDFSEWEHELLEDEAEEAAEGNRFWQDRYHPEFEPALPGKKRTPGKRGDYRTHHFGWRPAGRSPSEYECLALWFGLLSRLGDTPDLVTGYVHDGRTHEEFSRALGLFASVVPIRASLTPELTLAQLASSLADQIKDAGVYQAWLPADGESPRLLFEFGDRPGALKTAGITLVLAEHLVHYQPFDLKLVCLVGVEEWKLALHFDANCYPAAFIVDMADSFLCMLGASPDQSLTRVEAMNEDQRNRLLHAFNQTEASYAHEPCLHQLIEKQAQRAPHAVALARDGLFLSYGAMATAGTYIARELRRLGVKPGNRVAVCLPASPEWAFCLFGVMQTGAAYVPLDPLYPEERLHFMIADSGAGTIITSRKLVSHFQNEGQVLILEDMALGSERENEFTAGTTSALTAYVMYTSGSTGKPKGVMISHRNLVNYLSWCQRTYVLGNGWGAPVLSSAGFDLTVTSLFTPLLAGKCVVFPSEDAGVEEHFALLEAWPHGGLLKLTPSHLRLINRWLPAELTGKVARTLILGGEALRAEDVTKWLREAPETLLINEYGPTEATVGCCFQRITAADSEIVPIGKSVANTTLYLFDNQGQPTPPWCVGELWIGGDGLAAGYLGRPALTAEKFRPHPCPPGPGERLYRSGDRARFVGTPPILEFLGRRDEQVKIRGHRIELGEIEDRLRKFPGLEEAVVVVSEGENHDQRLVGYLVADPKPTVDALRDFLGAFLPDHMIPASFVHLERLPLTAHGKVDQARLPEPGRDRPELALAYEAPRDEVEATLAEIFGEVLGIDGIGIHDGFFTLGGDSIRSVQAVALALERGLVFSVQQLFLHQSIAALRPAVVTADEPDATAEEEDLAALLAEVEELSEEEAASRLEQIESRSMP